jgi:hypothetical protein
MVGRGVSGGGGKRLWNVGAGLRVLVAEGGLGEGRSGTCWRRGQCGRPRCR